LSPTSFDVAAGGAVATLLLLFDASPLSLHAVHARSWLPPTSLMLHLLSGSPLFLCMLCFAVRDLQVVAANKLDAASAIGLTTVFGHAVHSNHNNQSL
jgi:hypothetical protein